MTENKIAKNVIKMLEDIGFIKQGESFFVADIGTDDLKNILERISPNHFSPNGNRSLFLGHMYPNTEKEFWYATSNIQGTYRGYRCRNTYNSYDTGNIFASGKTCLECVERFIDNYITLSYNIS